MFNLTRLPAVSGDITVANDVLPGGLVPALRLDVGPEGGRLLFRARPGRVGDEEWRPDRTLVVPVYHEGPEPLTFTLRFWEEGEHDAEPHAALDLRAPAAALTEVRAPLRALDGKVDPRAVRTLAICLPGQGSRSVVWLAFPRLDASSVAHPADPP